MKTVRRVLRIICNRTLLCRFASIAEAPGMVLPVGVEKEPGVA